MKKIAIINDLSGFGKCSLTAAIPVLSALGCSACPLPTAVLTNQTGYKEHFCQDLTHTMQEFTTYWKRNHASFDAIYTGFVTGAQQLTQISLFLQEFLKEETMLLVDPVMGDDGDVYSIYSDSLLAGMKELSLQANLITPNLTEAALLAGKSADAYMHYQRKEDLLKFALETGQILQEQAKRPQEIIITGIKSTQEEVPNIYNLAITRDGHSLCQSPYFDRSFSGTGDLFASVLCGCKVKGIPTEDAVKLAMEFLLAGILDTMKENIPPEEGIHFENHLNLLCNI